MNISLHPTGKSWYHCLSDLAKDSNSEPPLYMVIMVMTNKTWLDVSFLSGQCEQNQRKWTKSRISLLSVRQSFYFTERILRRKKQSFHLFLFIFAFPLSIKTCDHSYLIRWVPGTYQQASTRASPSLGYCLSVRSHSVISTTRFPKPSETFFPYYLKELYF